MKSVLFLVTLAVLAFAPGPASAQQRIGYIDSEFILENVPEYATIQQQVDRLAEGWQNEVEQRQQQVDELFRDYQARELLYTEEERRREREEIMQAEQDVQRLRMQYFGPEGQLFQEQERLMRPVQERILAAVEEVAAEENYDYIFDKGGDFLFLYARPQFDLSNRVLQQLGIDIDRVTRTDGQ